MKPGKNETDQYWGRRLYPGTAGIPMWLPIAGLKVNQASGR
jgi:hypothetical protein